MAPGCGNWACPQFGLDREDRARIQLCDIDAALEELLSLGGSLNARLLGAHGPLGFLESE